MPKRGVPKAVRDQSKSSEAWVIVFFFFNSFRLIIFDAWYKNLALRCVIKHWVRLHTKYRISVCWLMMFSSCLAEAGNRTFHCRLDSVRNDVAACSTAGIHRNKCPWWYLGPQQCLLLMVFLGKVSRRLVTEINKLYVLGGAERKTAYEKL